MYSLYYDYTSYIGYDSICARTECIHYEIPSRFEYLVIKQVLIIPV